MNRMHHIARPLRRFARAEDGTALVEFAVILPLFLLLFFALIDFGRMGGDYTLADKALQRAARIAAVRPPVCSGVPSFNARGTVPSGTTPPKFGTSCTAGSTICAAPAAAVCAGQTGNATFNEIWAAVTPMLAADATPANLQFTYAYDPALNFLGGPYVPVVTVEIIGMNFGFVTPLSGLASLAGATSGAGLTGQVAYPAMRMTLPGEDLALGNDG